MAGTTWSSPFWILPALALSKLKLKDIMGYTVVSMMLVGVITRAPC
jgi:short-chain fatty acids transporter